MGVINRKISTPCFSGYVDIDMGSSKGCPWQSSNEKKCGKPYGIRTIYDATRKECISSVMYCDQHMELAEMPRYWPENVCTPLYTHYEFIPWRENTVPMLFHWE